MACVRRCIKDGCGGCVKRYAKDDMVLRLVTNIVMMIADADIIFSVLFLHVLYEKNTFVSLFFFYVCMIGLVTYLWGAVWFGPRRKLEVARLVFEYMKANPDQCTVEGYRFFEHEGTRKLMTKEQADEEANKHNKSIRGDSTYVVGIASTVYPPGSCPVGETEGRCFEDLKLNSWCYSKDINRMRDGLTYWKLSHIWNTIDRANVWNVMERHHSIPLYRLAVNGFLARPTGEDLSGILNAMALYAFTCGFSQLTIGAMLIAQHPEDARNPNQTIPLCISTLSLFFSILNIICDFPAALREADIEKAMRDSILQRTRRLREGVEKMARDTHKQMLADGKSDFDEGVEAAEAKRKDKISQGWDRKGANDELHNDKENLKLAWGRANTKAADFLKFSLAEANSMDRTILEVELDEFRKSREALERALKGDCKPESTLQQSLLRAEETFDAKSRDVYVKACRKLFDQYTSKVSDHLNDSADVPSFRANMKKEFKDYVDRVNIVEHLPHNINPTTTMKPPPLDDQKEIDDFYLRTVREFFDKYRENVRGHAKNDDVEALKTNMIKEWTHYTDKTNIVNTKKIKQAAAY